MTIAVPRLMLGSISRYYIFLQSILSRKMPDMPLPYKSYAHHNLESHRWYLIFHRLWYREISWLVTGVKPVFLTCDISKTIAFFVCNTNNSSNNCTTPTHSRKQMIYYRYIALSDRSEISIQMFTYSYDFWILYCFCSDYVS